MRPQTSQGTSNHRRAYISYHAKSKESHDCIRRTRCLLKMPSPRTFPFFLHASPSRAGRIHHDESISPADSRAQSLFGIPLNLLSRTSRSSIEESRGLSWKTSEGLLHATCVRSVNPFLNSPLVTLISNNRDLLSSHPSSLLLQQAQTDIDKHTSRSRSECSNVPFTAGIVRARRLGRARGRIASTQESSCSNQSIVRRLEGERHCVLNGKYWTIRLMLNSRSTLTSPIITLIVGRDQRLFAAHEDVLSLSPFFSAALKGQFYESASKRVDLPDE